MGADGDDDGHAAFGEQTAEVRGLCDHVPHHRLVGGLADPLSQRFHVVTGHAAVVREALVEDELLARPLGKPVVVRARKPPMGTKWSFLDEKTAPSDRLASSRISSPEVASGLSRLAVLDEDGVLGHPGRVEDQRDAVLGSQRADGPEVVERERLPAGHVQTCLLADEGDPLRADLVQHALERDEVDVALERVEALRIARLGHRDVVPDAAGELDVGARGREVEVGRHDRAGPDEDLRQQVLGATALVGRNQVAIAVDVVHRRLEPEVAARAGVGLVAELHRRALLLGHGGGAAVGEQVDEDVVGAEQERVPAGLLDCLPPPHRVRQRDRLDDLDLPGGRIHGSIVGRGLARSIRGAADHPCGELRSFVKGDERGLAREPV